MQTIDLRIIIENKFGRKFNQFPKFFQTMIVFSLERLFHINQINEFIEKNKLSLGLGFIDDLFELLDFTYILSEKDRLNIPFEGKLLCVSNHPLGGLDGLALIKLIGSVRPDVKIVANEVLSYIENLNDFFLPVDLFSAKKQKENLKRIDQALINDEAIIMFPAGSVSRLKLRGISDSKWKKGVIRYSQNHQVPVLPIHVKGRNSLMFYIASLISTELSMYLLPHELFNKKKKSIKITIGDPIPSSVFSSKLINLADYAKMLKKHCMKIGKNKHGILKTEKNIIHPVDKKIIKSELKNSILLNNSPDNKRLYLVNYSNAQNVVREIARLREITFRKVGEGTGLKADFDKFDKYYTHLLLWDDNNLEIIGSYRLGFSNEIIKNYGTKGLYNEGQFEFLENSIEIINQSMELGRSFIQQKYWRTNALDMMWQGIGDIVASRKDIKYLFGAVSISNAYSDAAKNLLVFYYKKWYSADYELLKSKNPYVLSKQDYLDCERIFTGSDHIRDFNILKLHLKQMGFTVPVLFRKYTGLCEYGGVKFLDFGVDQDFSNSIDGMMLLDITYLDAMKKNRYLDKQEVPQIDELVRAN